jgi:hypothetical protein
MLKKISIFLLIGNLHNIFKKNNDYFGSSKFELADSIQKWA